MLEIISQHQLNLFFARGVGPINISSSCYLLSNPFQTIAVSRTDWCKGSGLLEQVSKTSAWKFHLFDNNMAITSK